MNFDQEEFEDTTGVIRIRISKKNRQHNSQKKKYTKLIKLSLIANLPDKFRIYVKQLTTIYIL